MTASPFLVFHRCNRIEQLDALPAGCWIEIDLDVYEGVVYLHHDPLLAPPGRLNPAPERFDSFLAQALKCGISGFVLDCKRENVEKLVQPLLNQHGVRDYFYLNEMEIQADIFLEKDRAHRNGIRVWKYRNADDVLRYVREVQAVGAAAPTWVWVDCWQRGLLQDIHAAFLPLDGRQAAAFQKAGVKLCICSPELYVHQYGKDYSSSELDTFHKGVTDYRRRLEAASVTPDAVCTKFAPWWAS